MSINAPDGDWFFPSGFYMLLNRIIFQVFVFWGGNRQQKKIAIQDL